MEKAKGGSASRQSSFSVISLRLPGDMLREIDRRAGEQGCRRNDFLLRALGFALSRQGGKNGEKEKK